MVGLKVRSINLDGSINMASSKESLIKYMGSSSSIIIAYHSTFGDFNIVEICGLVHGQDSQVYLDGASVNAQSGFCQSGKYGADFDLHKTFAIPYGQIGVCAHLALFLPFHPIL